MLMPEVYYHADSDSVTVDLSNATNIVPNSRRLLVSNPERQLSIPLTRGLAISIPSQRGRPSAGVTGGIWTS